MLVKEALIEVLPDVIRTINEAQGSNYNYELPQKPSSIENFISETLENRSYGYSSLQRPSNKPLKNQRQVINGEHYASGQGILDWYIKDKKPDVIEHKEFKHSDQDMNKFIGNMIGKKIS